MQRVETCQCVSEDRNPLVYFPPPLLLSFERFTSLNPVSQHNHALCTSFVFLKPFWPFQLWFAWKREQNANYFIKWRKAENKRRVKYVNCREPPCGDDNLHLGAAYTGRKLDAQSYTRQSALCECECVQVQAPMLIHRAWLSSCHGNPRPSEARYLASTAYSLCQISCFHKSPVGTFSLPIVFASGVAGGWHPLVFCLLPPSLFPTIPRPPRPKGPSPAPS